MANKQHIDIKLENGDDFDIPIEGSLGLLALGSVGIEAWRTKRKEAGFNVVKNKKEIVAEWEKRKEITKTEDSENSTNG